MARHVTAWQKTRPDARFICLLLLYTLPHVSDAPAPPTPPKPTTNTSSAANQLAGPPSASATPNSATAEGLQTWRSKITVTYQKSYSYLVKYIHSQSLANRMDRAPEKRENHSVYHIIPRREKNCINVGLKDHQRSGADGLSWLVLL